MEMNYNTIKELFEKGIISLALLPEKNDFLLNEKGKELRKKLVQEEKIDIFHKLSSSERREFLALDKLDDLIGYTIPLTIHDYSAKTPLMWNTLYEQENILIRNIMVIADQNNLQEIVRTFRYDEKYLGGGMAVGFKEKIIPFLDEVKPNDLKAVNIIVKEKEKLVGYNTDSLGFVKSLEDSMTKIGKKIEKGNFVIYGAGGVAKEVTKLLAEKKAGRIRIVNRSFSKAVALAHFLNENYGQIAEGIGEELSRGSVLNSEIKVDALINLSDKGSDGSLLKIAMYSAADEHNEAKSRDLLRYLRQIRPDVVIADIVLPRIRPSVSLRLAKAEGLENLLDGNPMVINQAAPAYIYVQRAHPDKHKKILNEDQVLEIMKKAAS